MNFLVVRLFFLGLLYPALAMASTPMVAAGYQHSLALKSDGTVAAWGSNPDGQLGDGTNIGRNSPTVVVTPLRSRVQRWMALRNDIWHVTKTEQGVSK